jgi:hypothetical protein
MCLWCEVEERVYRSYEDQERKALEDIHRIEQECPGEESPAEESADRSRCLWEKKLEFVMARMQKERLAAEMAGSEACEPENAGASGRAVRRAPSPSLPPHLLLAFERYIETMFDRLTRDVKAIPPRRPRKLIPFENPSDPGR